MSKLTTPAGILIIAIITSNVGAVAAVDLQSSFRESNIKISSLPLAATTPLVLENNIPNDVDDETPQMPPKVHPTSRIGLWYWGVAVMLVLFAGCASGLTVGLLSLDPVQLKVLELEGNEEQKRRVNAVYTVIQHHHLLLVSLLLANSLAMEALPIFLDRLVPSWAAVLLSVTGILIFGEIIPQALCTGKYQLKIAQSAAPFVNLLMAFLFIVAWPIAKLLDKLLGDGDHAPYYARGHLKALIRMHERNKRQGGASGSDDSSSALGADEVIVIEGALDLASKTLRQIMLPIDEVFMLESTTPVDRNLFQLILSNGHSRIPVFRNQRNNIQGLLLTKSLLGVDPGGGTTVKDLMVRRRLIFSSPSTNLYDLLNEFQKGHSHIAFVTDDSESYYRAMKQKLDVSSSLLLGIATLEDVIEELIQEEIYDEFDKDSMSAGISKINGGGGGENKSKKNYHYSHSIESANPLTEPLHMREKKPAA